MALLDVAGMAREDKPIVDVGAIVGIVNVEAEMVGTGVVFAVVLIVELVSSAPVMGVVVAAA